MKKHPQAQEIKTLLDQSQKIAIFGHRNVDGDALGSCLWLGQVLENQWKEVNYFTTQTPSTSFDFLEWSSKFQINFDYHPHYDLLIFLDTANPAQLLWDFWVGHEEYFDKMPTLVIDHHISNTNYADTNLVDDSSIATCEIMAELLQDLYTDEIDAKVATYLFLWLSTDSWHFIYERDSTRTFEVATFLLSRWADNKSIISNLYRAASYKSIKFVWVLTERITKIPGVIYTYYRHEELEEYGVDKEKAGSILGIMTRIAHDGVFALIKIHDHESPAFLKASLRSKSDDVDVSQIAGQWGGGWHVKAAGLKTMIWDDWESELESFVGKLQ